MALQMARRLALRAVDEDYPPCIHIPHAFRSLQLYRAWRAAEGQPRQWLFDLAVSFWSHSMGGGATGASLATGNSLLAFLAKKDFALFHAAVYLATYWSPYDVVYRTLSSPRHPVRLLCVGADALDGITTLCGLVDKNLKSHPDNWLLPFITGLLMYNAGSAVRCLDARLRGQRPSSFLSSPGSGVSKSVVLTLAYCLFGRILWGGRRRDAACAALCWLVVAVEVAEDVLDFDAFARVHQPGLLLLQLLQRRFHLGPPALPDVKAVRVSAGIGLDSVSLVQDGGKASSS